MFTRLLNNPKLLYWLSLLFLLSLVFCVFCQLSVHDLDSIWLNSDTLYLPSMYKDLFLDGNTLHGWNVNPAPNFFPDMPLYFFAQWLTGSVTSGMFLFGLLQVSLISVLLLNILRQVSDKAYTLMAFGNVLLSLFMFVELVENDFSFAFQFIINSYHLGAFVNALVCVLITMKFLKSRQMFWLPLLVVYGVFAIASDRLFIVSFIAPMGVVAIVMLIKNTKNALLLLGSMAVQFFVGLWLYRTIKASGLFIIPDPHKYIEFENIVDSWRILMEQTGTYISDLSVKFTIILTVVVSLILALVRIVKNRGNYLIKTKPKPTNSDWLTLFIPVFLLGVFIAPVAGGNYTGWDTIRYNYSVYLLGMALFPFLLGDRTRVRLQKMRIYFIGCLAVLLVVVVARSPLSGFSDYINYYPDRVAKMDELARKKGIKNGVAPYWDAKVITMFSKENLRVYTAFEELTPWYHVTNSNWHYKKPGEWDKDIDFDFVLANSDVMKSNVYDLLDPVLDSTVLDFGTVYQVGKYRYNKENYLPFLLHSSE